VVATAVALCTALSWPRVVRAGNDDGVLLGNDAAMLGGAVTAAVSDGSSLWYNPAGLVHAHDFATIDVSASAFVLRHYRIPDFLSSSQGPGSNATFTELVSIPSAVTAVRQLGRHVTGALGLFTPRVDDYFLRTSLATTGDFTTRWQVALTSRESQYYAGAGVGFAPVPRVLLGVALFGSYVSSGTSSQVSGGLELPDGSVQAFGVQSYQRSDILLGLLLNVGVTIRVLPELHLGVSLRTPGMTVFRSQRITLVDASTGVDEDGNPSTDFEPVDGHRSEGVVSISSPLRARFGLAYYLPNGGVLGVDADMQPALRTTELQIDRKFTWNARLGVLMPFLEHYAAGLGLFTDRSPDKRLPSGAGPVDFYGFSLGFQYWNSRKLDASEPQPRLTFATTVAVRYAHGSGKVEGTYIDATTGVVSPTAREIAVDEIALHLGSALYF
jgi:hypothetical protein